MSSQAERQEIFNIIASEALVTLTEELTKLNQRELIIVQGLEEIVKQLVELKELWK